MSDDTSAAVPDDPSPSGLKMFLRIIVLMIVAPGAILYLVSYFLAQ